MGRGPARHPARRPVLVGGMGRFEDDDMEDGRIRIRLRHRLAWRKAAEIWIQDPNKAFFHKQDFRRDQGIKIIRLIEERRGWGMKDDYLLVRAPSARRKFRETRRDSLL